MVYWSSSIGSKWFRNKARTTGDTNANSKLGVHGMGTGIKSFPLFTRWSYIGFDKTYISGWCLVCWNTTMYRWVYEYRGRMYELEKPTSSYISTKLMIALQLYAADSSSRGIKLTEAPWGSSELRSSYVYPSLYGKSPELFSEPVFGKWLYGMESICLSRYHCDTRCLLPIRRDAYSAVIFHNESHGTSVSGFTHVRHGR